MRAACARIAFVFSAPKEEGRGNAFSCALDVSRRLTCSSPADATPAAGGGCVTRDHTNPLGANPRLRGASRRNGNWRGGGIRVPHLSSLPRCRDAFALGQLGERKRGEGERRVDPLALLGGSLTHQHCLFTSLFSFLPRRDPLHLLVTTTNTTIGKRYCLSSAAHLPACRPLATSDSPRLPPACIKPLPPLRHPRTQHPPPPPPPPLCSPAVLTYRRPQRAYVPKRPSAAPNPPPLPCRPRLAAPLRPPWPPLRRWQSSACA